MNDTLISMDEISDPKQQLQLLDDFVFQNHDLEFFGPHNPQQIPAKFQGPFLKGKGQLFYLELSTPEALTFPCLGKAKVFGDNMVVGLIFEITAQEGKRLTCKFPHKFYKINRREALRYRLTEKLTVAWTNTAHQGSALVYDLSVDGLGLMVPRDCVLVPNQTVQLKFKLKGEELELLGQIRSSRPLDKDYLKLGIKINKFSPRAQAQISNYINAQQALYLKKVV